MAINKRIFENLYDWVKRVLETESVDYCHVSDIDGDEYIVFLDKLGNDGVRLGAHELGKGPQIGREVVDNNWLRCKAITFYTYDPQPKLSGVKSDLSPTGKDIREKVHAIQSDKLACHQRGIHLFTDPQGRKWFLFGGSSPDLGYPRNLYSYFKLTCEKGIENYGGQGWMLWEHCHLYHGTWHFENLDTKPVPLDPEAEVTHDGKGIVSKELAARYTLTECDGSDDHRVLTIRTGTQDGVGELKHYQLTLMLDGLCKSNECVDLKYLIRRICDTEFPSREIVLREHSLVLDFGVHGRIWASTAKSKYGNRYYNSMHTSKPNWDRVEIRGAALPRTFA